MPGYYIDLSCLITNRGKATSFYNTNSGRYKLLIILNYHLLTCVIIVGTEMTDYTVMIGVGECTVTSLYVNLLKCRPPTELPEAGNDYKIDPDDSNNLLPAVIVSDDN